LFHANGQKDRQTDMKLIVAFHNFAKAPEKGNTDLMFGFIH